MAAAIISQYKTSHYLFTMLLVIQGLSAAIFTAPATAQDILFLPNTLPFSAPDNHSGFTSEVRSLSNLGLALQADLMRSVEMSAEQRAINYQWLSMHSGEEAGVNTKEVFSKFVKEGLMDYWQSKYSESRTSKFMTDRHGDFSSNIYDIDYKVSLSDNGVRFGFKYEFD